MKRVFHEAELEWMDRPNPDPAALAEDLRNLEKINRWFGGTAAVKRLGRKLGKEAVLVDLATGYGDHPRALAQEARARGEMLSILAVDRQFPTLQLARAATRPEEGIYYVQADIRQLPFKDQ